MKHWIVAYDICDPRRLARVHRKMVSSATPVEYSVFLFIGTDLELDACLQDVLKLIDVKQDDVRCYVLPLHGLQERVGPPTLPEGIHWTGLPACLH